jgi:hypothetical protein
MRHAGAETLAALTPLLRRLRAIAALTERRPGVFYLRSRAYLHFHEDPAGVFADLKADLNEFTRLRATTRAEQARLVALIRRSLRVPQR